jgi:hypothetical protein
VDLNINIVDSSLYQFTCASKTNFPIKQGAMTNACRVNGFQDLFWNPGHETGQAQNGFL